MRCLEGFSFKEETDKEQSLNDLVLGLGDISSLLEKSEALRLDLNLPLDHLRAIESYDSMACGLDLSDESFVNGFLDTLSPYECLLLESVHDEMQTYDLEV